jgi:L-threonylcarbamoyladenylate synthase
MALYSCWLYSYYRSVMALRTQIIRINPEVIELDKIKKIVNYLKMDGVIVYPTETFYALGADCFSQKAIQAVYRLKKRPPSKPLSVVISDLDMIREIVSEIPSTIQPLISNFWPGPLTLILKAAPRVPEELRGPSGSIGVRLTEHQWLRSLVRHASFPITATSANISGEKDISNPEYALRMFNGKVDLMVDGGETKGDLPSTVLGLSGKRVRIIREGAIPFSQLKKYLSP